jgi:exopolyphosphatase/pppGpp-phosphohydrolase
MRESDPTLRDTILTLARRYEFEEGHSLQDERLALCLFDETARIGLHRLARRSEYDHADNLPGDKEDQASVILSGSPTQHPPQRDTSEESPPGDKELLRSSSAQHDAATMRCSPRDILSSAAILHDIGYVDGYEQHHKTTFRLIMAEPIPGLLPHDQTLIAHVARYHRAGTPDPVKHPAFAALPVSDRKLVEQLGAMMRFADGLDRGHSDAIQDLRCQLDGNRLIITLVPGTNDESERSAGQKKARWFESVYGVRVILK